MVYQQFPIAYAGLKDSSAPLHQGWAGSTARGSRNGKFPASNASFGDLESLSVGVTAGSRGSVKSVAGKDDLEA